MEHIKNIKKAMRYYLMHFYYLIRNRKKSYVYFSSFSGQYSDSPKAISEAIHKLAPSIELVWLSNDKSIFPDYIKTVKKGSLKCVKAMAQAKVWITHATGGKESGIWKGQDVLSLATWHGDRGFKKVLYAALDSMGGKYVHLKDVPNFNGIDYLTVGSEYGIRQAREAFRYEGELLCYGLPRNDKLIHIKEYHEDIVQLKKGLGIPEEAKALLYAPTFRDNSSNQKVNVDLKHVLSSISQDGNNWFILIRAHNLTKNLNYKKVEHLIDVSDFGDMADLLMISDCLITDYSSCAGDFILMDKPCILAQFDRKEYEDNSRSFWFNPDDSGFLIARTQKELDYLLAHVHDYNHKKINKKVLDFFGTFESGDASLQVAHIVLQWLNDR